MEYEFGSKQNSQLKLPPFYAALAPTQMYSPGAKGEKSSKHSSRNFTGDHQDENNYYNRDEYNARSSFNSEIEAVKPRK